MLWRKGIAPAARLAKPVKKHAPKPSKPLPVSREITRN